MKKKYELSTTELLKKYASTEINSNEEFDKNAILKWFEKNYPDLKKVTVAIHITKMTTNDKSRINNNVSPNGSHDLFFKLPNGKYRLYNKESDPAPIYIKQENIGITDEIDEEDIESLESPSSFAYEKDLKNFLSKNLHLIEEGLTLYEEDGISGLEFLVGGRYIDILAKDKQDNFVVVELKVSKGYEKVVGQLLRYCGWIRKNLAEENQTVRGVIVARTISEDLIIACSEVSHIKLFEYSLSVKLNLI